MKRYAQRVAVRKAILELGGTQAALAAVLGRTQQTISGWELGLTPVPPAVAKKIERLTGGKVRREQLRPDVFGA